MTHINESFHQKTQDTKNKLKHVIITSFIIIGIINVILWQQWNTNHHNYILCNNVEINKACVTTSIDVNNVFNKHKDTNGINMHNALQEVTQSQPTLAKIMNQCYKNIGQTQFYGSTDITHMKNCIVTYKRQ